MLLSRISTAEKFSRQDYILAYKDQFGESNIYTIEYALRKAVSKGEIIHVGRDQYAVSDKRRNYQYKYSEAAVQIASVIREEYPNVDFRVFELTQLNAFVNHLLAHNTIFVSVENDVIDFVFDTLRNEYPGRVMLKPKIEEYYRYLVDDQIVILRLPTETPKGTGEVWHSRIEKILVDIVTDKLMISMIPESEYANIYEDAFGKYVIEYSALKRYANRRGALEKLRNVIKEYTDIKPEDIGV